MTWFFELFGFFATGPGAVATVGIVILMILIWDWRVALVGLVLVQISLATIAVQVFAVDVAWASAHLSTTLIACLVLAISMGQIASSRSLHQPGNWLMRVLAVAIFITAWQLIRLTIALPLLSASQTQFLTMLIVGALIMLSMSDNPLFTTVGMLLWMIVIQLAIEVLLPQPALITLLGVMQLLLALTGGYLALADRVPRRATRVVPSDITFPDAVTPVLLLDTDDSIDTPPLPMLPARLLTQRGDPSETGEHDAVSSGRTPA